MIQKTNAPQGGHSKPARKMTAATRNDSEVSDEDDISDSESSVEMTCATHVATATNANDYSLQNDFVYDTASNCHVCNDRSRFVEYEHHDGIVFVGNTENKIIGLGMINMEVTKKDGSKRKWKLTNVLHVPGFHTNVISSKKIRKNGLYLNEHQKAICDQNGKVMAVLKDTDGM